MLDKIIETLNTKRIKWFEDFDLGLIKLPLQIVQLDKEGKPYHYFLQLILTCFFSRVSFSFETNKNIRSGVICFYYNHLGKNRQDIQTLQNDVLGTIKNKDLILGVSKTKFHPFIGFQNLFKIVVWGYQLRTVALTSKERLMILRKLLEVSFFELFLKKITKDNFREYKLLLVFNDSIPYDNFLVQKFKLLNVKTATLQHGIILAPTLEDNFDFCGIELRCSNSDYFLAWNKFTKKQALKANIKESKIKILGIPKCISMSSIVSNDAISNESVFGVVLDGKYTAENNELLIKIANEYSEITGMNYILRFHPKMNIHIYDYLLTDKCIGISPKTDNIHYFCQNVRFSILANSTVFIEMVYYKHRVYRMLGIETLSKYKDVPQCSFEDVSDLLEKIRSEELGETAERTELYDELVTIEKIEESYKSFFENYLMN